MCNWRYGYCVALMEEISTVCWDKFSPVIKVSAAPVLLIPITSTRGLSPAVASIEVPLHNNCFHCFAGPNCGEVIYPTVSGTGQSADKVKLSNVPWLNSHWGVKEGSFFL